MDYGILALVPPVLAISLAILTKNVIVSLLVSIFVSVTILCGWNPITGFTTMINTYMFNALSDSTNMQTLFMIVVICGFVRLLSKCGGASAFTSTVTRHIKSRAACETGIWLGGLAIWFTDNGNSMIVGPIFEALAEKLRVSREKFSYILDCTTTPICALIPFIGWGVYTMGLIESELNAAEITYTSSMEVFVQGIPLNFYAILTLAMAGLMAITQWDFGPMLKAQNRSMLTGKTIRDGGEPMRSLDETDILPENYQPKLSTMLIPLAVVLIIIFSYLTINGLWHTKVPGSVIRTGVASGFLVASFVLTGLCVKEKIFSFQKCLDIWMEGASGMMFMCIILVLSWTLSGISSDIGTAAYLVSISKDYLDPAILPFLVFLLGAVLSFATGTSWGTMAILYPIAMPIAINFGVALPLMSSAIVSSAIFGDHCSPISDTTLMASIGAGSDHIDHFETQMPYAVVCASVVAVMLLLTNLIQSKAILLIGGFIVLSVIVFILHKASVKKYGVVKVPGGSETKNN